MNNLSLGEILTWNSPLTYFFLSVIVVAFLSVRAVFNVNQIMRENGIQLSYNFFGSYYNNWLKWTSTHETKTGILIFLLVLSAIILAIKF